MDTAANIQLKGARRVDDWGHASHPDWFAASGGASWTYTLSACLRRTSGSAGYYRLRSRAKDRVGNVESGFIAGVNESTFEIE